MKRDYRIAFFGTPQFSVAILDELERANLTPTVIVTAPDAPQGRGLTLTPPPVKGWAEAREIPILQPQTLRQKGTDMDRDVLYNSEWDMFIVASYGKILPKELLAIPPYGTLNVHPSLLPEYRGASPIRSAILDDNQGAIGVSIMLLDEGVDSGPILAQGRVEVEEWPPHAEILEQLLAHEGGKLLAEVIPLWIQSEIIPEPQDATRATFSKKITKEMGELNLKEDAYKNYVKIRGLEGWPGTFFFIEKKGKRMRIKITDASYEDGKLVINTIIPEGKKEMRYDDFMRN